MSEIANISTLDIEDEPPFRNIATLAGHSEGVSCLAFSRTGGILASGSDDGTVQLWDTIANMRVHSHLHHAQAISGVAWSPNNFLLSSSSHDGTITCFDFKANRDAYIVDASLGSLFSISMSRDGYYLACGGLQGVCVYDLRRTGDGALQLARHTENYGITGISFSPDSQVLFSAGSDAVSSLDLASGEYGKWFSFHSQEEQELNRSSLRHLRTGVLSTDLKINYNTNYALIPHTDHTLRLWNMTTGHIAKEYRGHSSTTHHVKTDFLNSHGQSKVVAGSDDGTIYIWGLHSSSRIQRLVKNKHNDAVNCVASHPRKAMFASGGGIYDQTVKFWTTST